MDKSDKSLISACRLWDLVTNKMNNALYARPPELERWTDSMYAPHDFNALQCRIDGKKAELTVGSSTGHRAHMDLAAKKFDYYDNRSNNNWAIWKMLQLYKIDCKRDTDGVHCTGVNTKAKLNGIFRVMAMPASMDYRRGTCEQYFYDHHKGSDAERREKVKEFCIAAEVKMFTSGPKHTVLKGK